MEYETLMRVLTVIAVGLGILNTVAVWLLTGARKVQAQIDAHEKKLTDHDRRIQSLEGDFRHLPSSEEMEELKIAVTRLDGRIATFDEQLDSLRHTVRRVDDYLREKGR